MFTTHEHHEHHEHDEHDYQSPYPVLDRRASGRSPRNGRGWWLRRIQPTQIVAALALLSAVFGALGWRRITVDALDARLTATEHRVDTLSDRLRFISYLQCVQLRKTDPASLPPDCAPIIERGGRP